MGLCLFLTCKQLVCIRVCIIVRHKVQGFIVMVEEQGCILCIKKNAVCLCICFIFVCVCFVIHKEQDLMCMVEFE